jgi:hypothetical protein
MQMGKKSMFFLGGMFYGVLNGKAVEAPSKENTVSFCFSYDLTPARGPPLS